jgi:site-specific recombinase XerD
VHIVDRRFVIDGRPIMLSEHVPTASTREHLQTIIPTDCLEQFCNWLVQLRYTRLTIRSYLSSAARFVCWAQANGFPDFSALDRACLGAYQRHLLGVRIAANRKGDAGNSVCAANAFARFLRERGIVQAEPSNLPPLVIRFSDWMRNHRGSQESTLSNYQRELCRLLLRIGEDPRLYTAAQLRAFVVTESCGFGHSKAELTVTAVRMFLRFLIAHRECPEHLQHAIPRLASWGKTVLPRYIAAEAVERVISSCDVSTPLGSRDHAVLLLLARLALRAGDVANLRLKDLDWAHARVTVTGKSRRSAWLPLPQDVGEAILHYLATGRPHVPDDRLFLIARAPYSGMLARQVSATAERAFRRSAIPTPSFGAHVFRHSAATTWLRAGLSLQSIGVLLRHSDVDTTAIYAKVDVSLLQQIALPWPEESAPC